MTSRTTAVGQTKVSTEDVTVSCIYEKVEKWAPWEGAQCIMGRPPAVEAYGSITGGKLDSALTSSL